MPLIYIYIIKKKKMREEKTFDYETQRHRDGARTNNSTNQLYNHTHVR